jgi:hypothetical protein
MATKSDFTEAEWEKLQKGATGAGMLVAVSDRGFFDTFKEAGALAKHLAESQSKSSSELVRELATTRGTGFGLTSSPSEIESETLEALRSSVQVLGSKAPAELPEYRAFVLDLAQSVSKAAGGGDDVEGTAIEKIASAVEGESTTSS